MSAALETLQKKLDELKAEQNRIYHQFQAEIDQIEVAIETLSGKTVWERIKEEPYDDQNPNYIKGSFEEM